MPNGIEEVAVLLPARSKLLANGCTVWLGSKTSQGYGRIRFNKKWAAVHRVAYLIYIGEIPKGLHVLHSCDNPSCIEPKHFFLGSNEDNIADKCAKDRSGKKLTSEKVLEIRELVKTGLTHAEIGKIFGVAQSNITRAINGTRWAHLKRSA